MKILTRILAYTATIAVAIFILDSEIVQSLILRLTPIKYVAEFVAGMFYTSLITTPISIAMLASIAETSNIYFIAAVGGLGAVCGDFLLMNVFSKLSREIKIKKKPKIIKKIPAYFLRVIGIFCLILPVPDEVAMALLGISKIQIKTFILIVYPAKAMGILLVTLGASNLLG